MIRRGRAPEWVGDNIVITDDPAKVIDGIETSCTSFKRAQLLNLTKETFNIQKLSRQRVSPSYCFNAEKT